MTITVLGEMTVGAALPGVATAAAGIDLAVGAALPAVQAQLAGYLSLQAPSASFSIGAQLDVAVASMATAMAELSALPGGVGLAASLTAGVAAQLAAQAAIKTAYPSVALKIDAALAAQAGLSAGISVGVTGPNVDLPTVALKVAEIGSFVSVLEAQADIAADLAGPLATGGIRVLLFDGAATEFGAEIGAAVSGMGIHRFKTIVLVATSGAAWAGLQATMKTS